MEWKVGADEDGKDSVAGRIADAEHWPNLAVLILVASFESTFFGQPSSALHRRGLVETFIILIAIHANRTYSFCQTTYRQERSDCQT